MVRAGACLISQPTARLTWTSVSYGRVSRDDSRSVWCRESRRAPRICPGATPARYTRIPVVRAPKTPRRTARRYDSKMTGHANESKNEQVKRCGDDVCEPMAGSGIEHGNSAHNRPRNGMGLRRKKCE